MRDDYEAMLVGNLMLDASRLADIDLVPSEFAVQSYRAVYEAILDVAAGSQPVDVITVAESLQKSTGKNWLTVLADLAKNTAYSSNVGHYAKVVRDSAQRRVAGEIAERLRASVDTDGMAAVDSAIRDLLSLNITRRNYEYNIKSALTLAVDDLDQAFQVGSGVTGVPTGLADLDGSLGGLHNGDLIVVGARPAMGKTAFMLNIADRCGVPVGVMSGEQGHGQVGMRFISMHSKVSVHRMRTGDVKDEDWPKITTAVCEMANRQCWINDKPNPSIDDVLRQTRKWVHQHGVKLVLIDYLQKIRGNPKLCKREQIGEAVVELKSLARDLNIPVVVLAQINREVEKRPNKRPYVSDLKEYGEIEQEADQIMLLYRDEVYNEDTPDKGMCEINIGKNRHGPTGTIRTVWREEFMRFDNYFYVADRLSA